MGNNKRSFIMEDITLKNMDGCTKYSKKKIKIFLIFNFSRKDKILHFFGNTFIQIFVAWNIPKQM